VPVRAAYRRATAAVALRTRGRESFRASRLLAAARRELTEIGAGRYLRAIEAQLATTVGQPRPSAPAPSLLGSAEQRVAGLIAAGYTDARIADQLKTSQQQVTRLVGRVQRKLGVTTRGHVASWARQRGVAGTLIRS